jgi:hypothetical protein
MKLVENEFVRHFLFLKLCIMNYFSYIHNSLCMSWHIRGIIGVSIIFSIYDPLTRVVKSNVNFYITSGYSIASINDIVKDISGEKYRKQKTALCIRLFFCLLMSFRYK